MSFRYHICLLWIVYVYLCSLQAVHSIESDEEFAIGLQQQEFALLDDSRIARNLQVILKCTVVIVAGNHQTCKDRIC